MAFDIHVDKAPAAVDPDLSKAVKTNRPAVAKPTSGPNRHTTFVPSESTTFSLGEKCPERINDVGITGRTDNHVHLHVQTNRKTLVTLGSGATEVAIDALDGRVPKKMEGYAMVTDEYAYHDAKKQHFVISREGDVVARAVNEGVLVQSDKKTVQISGGHAIDMTAKGNISLSAFTGLEIENTLYMDKVLGLMGDGGAAARKALTVERAAFAAAVVQMFYSVADMKKKKKGQSGWAASDPLAKVKFLLEIEGFIGEAAEILGLAKESESGDVKVAAESNVAIEAGNTVNLYGRSGAKLTSWGSAGVFGKSASVSSLTWTSLWSGLGTTVESVKDVVLEGREGTASIKGKRGVDVLSEDGEVAVFGRENVMISSVEASSYFHGAEMVFVGAGTGSGWGMKASAKKNEIHLGKVASGAQKWNNPGFASKNKLFIKENKMELLIGQSKIALEPASIKQDASGAFEVKAGGNVKIKGAKVLLG